MTSSTFARFSPPASASSDDVTAAVMFVDVTWFRVTPPDEEKWREDGVRMSAMRKDVGFVQATLLQSPSATVSVAASEELELDEDEEDG